MKAKFSATLLFLLLVLFRAFALQPENNAVADSTSKQTDPKLSKAIWINAGQAYFHKEIQVGFEKELSPGMHLEGTLGYKYATQEGQVYHADIGSLFSLPKYYDYVARIPYSTGLLASVAIKAYFNKIPGFYFSPQIFYRYWFYNHQKLNSYGYVSDSDQNFESQQSLRMHVAGAKFLGGYTFKIIRFSPSHILVADIYSGIGFRQKFVETRFDWYHDSRQNYGPYSQTGPYTTHEKSGIISLHFGAKLGLMFLQIFIQRLKFI